MQLQNLCSLRLNVEEDLLEELGRLPQDLANTYAQIFEHVRRLGPQSRVIAESSLKWLLCQARELSEAEFLAAVSMGSERESVNLTKETILFICGNLVMFDQELNVFRFAHLSVREYLETRSEFTLGAAHALVAEMSLLVCLHRYTELAAKHARKFRRYAILYWLYHCQEAKPSGLGGSLLRLLKDFLHIRRETHLYYAKWVRSMHRLKQRDARKSDRWRVESDDESSDDTHDNSTFGTLKVWRPGIRVWNSGNRLSKTNQDMYTIPYTVLGDRDHPYDPTFAACSLDLPEIVEQNLLSMLSSPAKEAGDLALGNIEVFGRRNLRKQTYLHVACLCGSSKLLRLLLRYRFPVGSKDIVGSTALHYAVNPRKLVSLHPARWIKVVPDAHDQAYTAERVAMIGLLVEKESLIDAVDKYGQTALHRAADENRCAEAQFLLEHGAFVDARAGVLPTPLLLAAKSGHSAVAQLLLQFKANKEAKDKRGRTPLLLAADSGHTAIAQLLLQFNADTEARDDDYGMTPLLQAAESGQTAIAQLLLQFKADIEARNFDQRTSLLQAAESGHTTITQLLLQSKADIEARDFDQRTSLLQAAESGHTTITHLLLQSRANIEARDKCGRTPLLLAAQSGNTTVARLLLQSNADIEARDCYKRTPLFQTVIKGHTDTARLILQFGTNINAKNSHGKTPLMCSIEMRNQAMAEMLIKEGAYAEVSDLTGNTALHYAAASKLRVVVSGLLETGAQENVTNVYGSTPLHVAIDPKCAFPIFQIAMDHTFHTVHLLADAEASIEISDNEGRTPLHLAARMADEASIRILLNRGANIMAEDNEGLLPLDHAARSGSLQVFSYLFKQWADIMAKSSESAVETWLQVAPREARGAGVELLRDWRSLSLEDLIELTSDREVKENWTNKGPEKFSSWFRERQVRRESEYERARLLDYAHTSVLPHYPANPEEHSETVSS